MQRAWFACLTIVAAFQLRPVAASPVVEDVPIGAAAAAMAERLDFDPARDPPAFMPEAIRLLYPGPDSRPSNLNDSRPSSTDAAVSATTRVPVPLPAAVWSRAVFHRTVSSDQLVAAILADRQAAFAGDGAAVILVQDQVHGEADAVAAAHLAKFRIAQRFGRVCAGAAGEGDGEGEGPASGATTVSASSAASVAASTLPVGSSPMSSWNSSSAPVSASVHWPSIGPSQ